MAGAPLTSSDVPVIISWGRELCASASLQVLSFRLRKLDW